MYLQHGNQFDKLVPMQSEAKNLKKIITSVVVIHRNEFVINTSYKIQI